MEAHLIKFRKDLGERIAYLRKKKGLEQTELAAILGGKDKQFINRYERTGANPTAFILVQLAKNLDVTVDELLNFDNLKKQ